MNGKARESTMTFGGITLILAVPLAISVSVATAQDFNALARALDRAKQENWNEAIRAVGPRGTVERDVIDWLYLRSRGGTAEEALDFLARNGDWPGLPYLRRQSEASLEGAERELVLRFFSGVEPQTALGALALAKAQRANGQRKAAETTARQAWLTLPMGIEMRDEWIGAFGPILAPLHGKRLDALLWAGHYESARAMLSIVSGEARALGRARLALYGEKRGVDQLIAEIPPTARSDPGLAHARVSWRFAKGLEKTAYDLTLTHSKGAETLGNPSAWGRLRLRMAREAMRDGETETAYLLASRNFLDTRQDQGLFAELEWIAGFVALRILDRPETALKHFERFDTLVHSPISKARSGYWRGRTLAAAGARDAAQKAYTEAAHYQTAFYGLLAAEQVDVEFDSKLIDPPIAKPLEGASFLSSSVFRAGILLLMAGDHDLGERFLTHLAESLPPEETARIARMAMEIGQPHLATSLAKRVASVSGEILYGYYFPPHPVGELDLPIAPEMVLAVARRESEFDSGVTSHAGALGLMQVMPATGARMARAIGAQNHSQKRMLQDWPYNARLGAEYLRQMADEFDGNIVMTAAAYNAGPARPKEWMKRFGDPRTDEIDIVDWIEMIPFGETRNYVMRVAESLPVYRARIGKEPLPVGFSDELVGSTLTALAQ